MIDKDKFIKIYRNKINYCKKTSYRECEYYDELHSCQENMMLDIIDEYNYNELEKKILYDNFLYKVSGIYNGGYNFRFTVYKSGVRLEDIREMFCDDYTIESIDCVGKIVNDKYEPY